MGRRKREPEPPRLVACEGPLGVGKTAFVEAWAEQVGARLVTVDPGTNPFLPGVFEAARPRAFSAQMFFLLARDRQQVELRQTSLFDRALVTDYVFARDRIYAEQMLSAPELALYERIHGLLEPRAVVPDLLVLLRAPPERLLERLRVRGAPAERGIGRELVDALALGFHRLGAEWSACPVVHVDLGGVDLYEDEEATHRLVEAVRRAAPELEPGARIELSARRKA